MSGGVFPVHELFLEARSILAGELVGIVRQWCCSAEPAKECRFVNHPPPPSPSSNRPPSFQASPEKLAGASASSSSESPCFYSESRASTSSGPLTSASWINSRKGRFPDSSRFQNSRPVTRTLPSGYPARAVPLGVRYRFVGMT